MCKKCGSRTGGRYTGPQYSVRSKAVAIDGETASVFFRSAVSFTYNDMPFFFQTSQVIRLNYVHIRAALEINCNVLLFNNPVEKQDFLTKYPEAKACNI